MPHLLVVRLRWPNEATGSLPYSPVETPELGMMIYFRRIILRVEETIPPSILNFFLLYEMPACSIKLSKSPISPFSCDLALINSFSFRESLVMQVMLTQVFSATGREQSLSLIHPCLAALQPLEETAAAGPSAVFREKGLTEGPSSGEAGGSVPLRQESPPPHLTLGCRAASPSWVKESRKIF